MDATPSLRTRRTVLLAGATIAATLIALAIVAVTPAQAAGTGPCDIYAAGGTPCVAAHSTTRALFGTYNGPLYQVRRSSDNATRGHRPAGRGRNGQRRRRRTRSAPTRPA